MKHKFYISTTLCGLLFAFIVACLFTDVTSTDNHAKTDGPVIILNDPVKLPVVIGRDTTRVSLAKGDSIRVIGFTRLTYQQKVLVETIRGNRGELDVSLLPIKHLVVGGEQKGDTLVRLVPIYASRSNDEYSALTSNGETIKLRGEDFVPLLVDWERFNLDNSASTSIVTQRALEKCKGMSFEKIEQMYGMAYNILMNVNGGKTATFRIYAYDSEGKPYKPIITFNRDGQATDFRYHPVTGKSNNSLFLGNSFAGKVIDMPLTRLLTRSDVYSIPSKTGKPTPWYLYVLLVFQIVILIVWYVLTPSLIVLLLGWLIEFPLIFRPLGNEALRLLLIVAAILSATGWAVALMAWGMHWCFVIPVFVVMWFVTRFAMKSIAQRCTKCGHLCTIVFDHEEVTGTEFRVEPYSKFKSYLGNSTSYDQFDQHYSTYWSDGSVTHGKRTRNVKFKHETREYEDYDVTFLVTHKKLYYVCSICGHTETFTDDIWEEVSRKKTGSHTERTTEVDSIY